MAAWVPRSAMAARAPRSAMASSVPRPSVAAWSAVAAWVPGSAVAAWVPDPPWPPESPDPPWPPESPDPPWPPESPDPPWPLSPPIRHGSRNGHRPGGHLSGLQVLEASRVPTLPPLSMSYAARTRLLEGGGNVRLCLPLPLSPHPYMVLPVPHQLVVSLRLCLDCVQVFPVMSPFI